jgi:hypothetical protein
MTTRRHAERRSEVATLLLRRRSRGDRIGLNTTCRTALGVPQLRIRLSSINSDEISLSEHPNGFAADHEFES